MPLKILIVDDSATDRLLIQKMLGRYNVITAVTVLKPCVD